ncbi:MAG: TauD/TfdA family dioxygenase [Alphaproteobacteria bacterium]|nr:TauD/TfdA family dioxygenase [Alphaproteobacteria bacterium]
MRTDDCLVADEGTPLRIADRDFDGPAVWRGGDLAPSDWLIPLDDAVAAELDKVVAQLRRHALPVLMLEPAMFELTAARALMADIKRRLSAGRLFAVLDSLPLDAWRAEEAKAVYWLLAQLLSQPVAQEWNGLIFKDVVDSGTDGDSGNERAVTNRALLYHVDNSGNLLPPDYNSLLCIHPAKTGGRSQYCSIYSLHNALRTRHPKLLERLYQPFYHDRVGVQTPGEPEVLVAPAMRYDGERLQSRYSSNKIRGGYRKMQESLDPLGDAALDAVIDTIESDGLAIEFSLQRGQILYHNNPEGLHHRTDFTDDSDPEKRRHLVRIWYRNEGRPFFDG